MTICTLQCSPITVLSGFTVRINDRGKEEDAVSGCGEDEGPWLPYSPRYYEVVSWLIVLAGFAY